MNPRNGTFKPIGVILALVLLLPLAGCVVEWPIAKEVYTTAEQQVVPVPVPAGTEEIGPAEVSRYAELGYGAWEVAPGTNYSLDAGNPRPYDKRVELAPGHTDVTSAARLLSFFTVSDVHLSDKESPAMLTYAGSSAGYGANIALETYYTPAALATTQVLDAAIQTVNALHKKTPFDFGISLGDEANATQHNELRWFIDVLDGKVITPSSGAHLGAATIDYQKPFKAAGLDKAIPWYQAIGNHDQFWLGGYENDKSLQAHIGNTVFNMSMDDTLSMLERVNTTGYYMGVVDGTTPYGDIIKAGPEEDFAVPPTVAADENRRSLATATSPTLNGMREFFNTTSKPVGHGFTQANLDADFACYSFEPKSDLPLKVIVLDDTWKKANSQQEGDSPPDYAAGYLDPTRKAWLKSELDEGQNSSKLMIIAAHIPLLPQWSITDSETIDKDYQVLNDSELLSELHSYPNLILWIAGHRHVNVVTPQPYDPTVATQGPENSFWEVETCSLRDFPQQFRTFDIRRNTDNTISIFVTNVTPAVREGSPAAKSRAYAIGAFEIFATYPFSVPYGHFSDPIDPPSQSYNAELVKVLTPEMQVVIANCGTPLE
jgi:metallophosphoesterase (TIGR03768 family)